MSISAMEQWVLDTSDIETYEALPVWAKQELRGRYPSWTNTGNAALGWQLAFNNQWYMMSSDDITETIPVEFNTYALAVSKLLGDKELRLNLTKDEDFICTTYNVSFGEYKASGKNPMSLGLNFLSVVAHSILQDKPSISQLGDYIEEAFYDRDGHFSVALIEPKEVFYIGKRGVDIMYTTPYSFHIDDTTYDKKDDCGTDTEILYGTIDLWEGTARMYTKYGVTEADLPPPEPIETSLTLNGGTMLGTTSITMSSGFSVSSSVAPVFTIPDTPKITWVDDE